MLARKLRRSASPHSEKFGEKLGSQFPLVPWRVGVFRNPSPILSLLHLKFPLLFRFPTLLYPEFFYGATREKLWNGHQQKTYGVANISIFINFLGF